MSDIQRDAWFSDCRRYRFALWRKWAGGNGYALFILLNPSTANENEEDATSRRVINYSKAWGYSGVCIANLFALCATDPLDMMRAPDPVGPGNDWILKTLASGADVVVAGWGVSGQHMDRGSYVRAMIPNLHYLRLTKDGHPTHPLYLPKDLTPTLWVPDAA